MVLIGIDGGGTKTDAVLCDETGRVLRHVRGGSTSPTSQTPEVAVARLGQILSALSGELKGRTAVIIAHRLTAVKNAAEILYMDKGRVLERGTHEQLLAKNGAYAEMWRKQQREEESA